MNREEAVNWIINITADIGKAEHRDLWHYEQALYEIRELLEGGPEPQWIPCSERLPEEKDAGILKKLGVNKRSDHVLATVKAKGEYMTVQTCTYDGVWHWDMKYAFPNYEIIAWMPLPDPYKERRKE